MNTLKTKETITRPRPGIESVMNSEKVMPETEKYADRFKKIFINKVRNDVTRYIIEQYFEGIISGADPESIASLFSENVDFYIPGHLELVPWIGLRKGRAGVVDFVNKLREEVASIDFDVRSILVDGAEAVALGAMESRARSTEEIIESEFAMNFTVHNARITRFRLFEVSLAVAAQDVKKQDLVSSYY